MRTLVFCAHPDDAEFAMGGTLIKLARTTELTLAVITDGSAGSYGTPEGRAKEQEEAANFLGCKLVMKGLRDCSLQHNQEHVEMIAEIIREEKPDAIFSPHWNQPGDVLDGKAHPEHRILGQIVKDAARYARFNVPSISGEKHKCTKLYWYMLSSGTQAKICVSVDDVVEDMQKLWEKHHSQTSLHDGRVLTHLLEQRKRHAKNQLDVTYAEVFDHDKPLLITEDCFFIGLH